MNKEIIMDERQRILARDFKDNPDNPTYFRNYVRWVIGGMPRKMLNEFDYVAGEKKATYSSSVPIGLTQIEPTRVKGIDLTAVFVADEMDNQKEDNIALNRFQLHYNLAGIGRFVVFENGEVEVDYDQGCTSLSDLEREWTALAVLRKSIRGLQGKARGR